MASNEINTKIHGFSKCEEKRLPFHKEKLLFCFWLWLTAESKYFYVVSCRVANGPLSSAERYYCPATIAVNLSSSGGDVIASQLVHRSKATVSYQFQGLFSPMSLFYIYASVSSKFRRGREVLLIGSPKYSTKYQ